jgi:hypothetical protein
MRDTDPRPTGRKKPTQTATEEVLEEVKELGEQEDTDTTEGTPEGTGDPVTPSRPANRKTAEGHPSD